MDPQGLTRQKRLEEVRRLRGVKRQLEDLRRRREKEDRVRDNLLQREKRKGRRNYLFSGLVFAGGYILIALMSFLMLLVIPGQDWLEYIRSHTVEESIFLISLFVLLLIVYLYFLFEDRTFLKRVSNSLLYFCILIISLLLCYAWGIFIRDYVYTRPYAVFAFLSFFLLGRRNVFFLNAVFVFILFAIDLFAGGYAQTVDASAYSTLLIGFTVGILAVFLANRVATRVGLLLSGIILILLTVPVALIFQIPVFKLDGVQYIVSMGYQFLGSILTVILSLTVIPLFEWMFNRLTTFRLRELTSTNAPLLARLNREASGTFNHSTVVAQLSEACALAIGEDPELVRAAALYHDVGKLKEPDCFTENQTNGYNIHNELTPELSADIIRSHTKDGYDLILASHLPKAIADIALEHHGTMPIKYFYDKALRVSGGEASIDDYKYFGPVPQSKIAAIIMIADGAEAATRASDNQSEEQVDAIVRGIIEERMDLGQFDECDITFRELTIIRQTLVGAIARVHHKREKYPPMRFGRKKAEEPKGGEEANG